MVELVGNGTFSELMDLLGKYTDEVLCLRRKIGQDDQKKPGRHGRLIHLEQVLIPSVEDKIRKMI